MEKIRCAYTELVDVEKLVPNPKNNNKHPKKQIERLAKIIEFQGQRAPVVVSNRSGFIVKGHGRLEAIKLLGWKKCAVDYQDYETEAQEYADMIADNPIATWAEFDDEMLLKELENLDIDTDMLGMVTLPNKLDEEDDTYTTKTEIPQYEIKGEKVSIEELVNSLKKDILIEEINSADISEEEKEFLRMASNRHNVFNYAKIAEYYASASPEMQKLMEKNALVLIDIEDAIKNGYTELSDAIESVLEKDNGEG